MMKARIKCFKKLLFVVINSLIFTYFGAQNLVQNSGFEIFNNCPDIGQITYCESWSSPTQWGTPDYFNGCSMGTSVPNCNINLYCYQNDENGQAFTGLYTYGADVADGREYIQSKLVKVIENDRCYHISFKTNLLNSSNYASNNIGVALSNTQINSTQTLLSLNPICNIDFIVTDTLNWLYHSNTFKSIGNEEYIIIGNFYSDNMTETVIVNSGFSINSAYYFIDDVSLFQLGDGYAGKDSSILLGNSIFIGQNVENLPSKWSILGGVEIANNVSGVLISPTVTTTYVCEQNFCGEVMYDTITITVVDDAGLEDLKENENRINVYPNPSNNNIYFSKYDKELESFEIRIYDLTGKLILEKELVLGVEVKSINVDVSSGVYKIELINEATNEKTNHKIHIIR